MKSHVKRNAMLAVAALLFAAESLTSPLAAQTPHPTSLDPAVLPSRDEHQGVLIAADPYLTSARSKKRFGKKHPYAAGILAVEVYVRNDTDREINLSPSAIELRVAPPGAPPQQIQALTSLETAARIIDPGVYNPNEWPPWWVPSVCPDAGNCPPRDPEARFKKKLKAVKKLDRAIAPQCLIDSVGPHSTIHGLLFFDMGGQFQLTAESRIYFPKIRLSKPKQDMIFFDVSLQPAVKLAKHDRGVARMDSQDE